MKHNSKTAETLKTENEEFKKKYEEATSKVVQLEEDIMTVTQKAIAKETELDRYTSKLMLYFTIRMEQNEIIECLISCSLKDKLKKVVLEKEQLECQLKTEKDEKELYKVM